MRTEDIKDTGRDKLKEYGKEGLAPLMELFNRYGKDIVRYMRHVGEGLEQGSQSLQSAPQDSSNESGVESDNENSDERQLVASWFEEGARWVDQLEKQLEQRNSDELLEFVERQGREHPAALFATSLVAGSVFGVVGKQAVKASPQTEASDDISSGDISSATTRNETQQNIGKNI